MSTTGHGVRISRVAEDEIVSWREQPVCAYELFRRTERSFVGRGHRSGSGAHGLSPCSAGDPDLTEDPGDRDGQEGELGARVLALLYSSADRRFRKWEDVVLDSFACKYEACHASR